MKMTQLQNLFFHEKTLEHYTDRSVLEVLLTTAGITGDIPSMIDGLYAAFGSFRGILGARPEQLMKVPHVTKRAATMIAMVIPLVRILERDNMEEPDTIGGCTDAEAYCKSLLMGERNEQFYVIALNARLKILGCRKVADGSVNAVHAFPRKVVETALNYNACAVVLCHNHPGGTCKPSAEDLKVTRYLHNVLDSVDIQLMDHLIVADNKSYSMVQNGDLHYHTPGQKKAESPKKKTKKNKDSKKKQ